MNNKIAHLYITLAIFIIFCVIYSVAMLGVFKSYADEVLEKVDEVIKEI